MELKQLQYFMAIAEEGSISGASKRLYMSQPPLSAQMKLLEQELGTVLFERGARKIRLTDAGKQLYRRASAIAELCTAAKEEAAEFGRRDGGCVRFGVVSSIAEVAAGRWMPEFDAKHPHIRFEITEGNTYQLLEKLNTDLLHFAVVRTPFSADGIRSCPLGEERIVAVGTKEMLGSSEMLPPGRIGLLPLILYRRWEKIIRQEAQKKNLDLNCICLCDDARTALSAAAGGTGAALLPESAASAAQSSGMHICGIPEISIHSGIVLISREGGLLPACATEFMTYIKTNYCNAEKTSSELNKKNKENWQKQ